MADDWLMKSFVSKQNVGAIKADHSTNQWRSSNVIVVRINQQQQTTSQFVISLVKNPCAGGGSRIGFEGAVLACVFGRLAATG